MITIVFHSEFTDGELVVWADSPQLPGFSAAGSTIAEVRALAAQHLEYLGLDGPTLEELEGVDSIVGGAVAVFHIYVNGIEVDWPQASDLMPQSPLSGARLVDA